MKALGKKVMFWMVGFVVFLWALPKVSQEAANKLFKAIHDALPDPIKKILFKKDTSGNISINWSILLSVLVGAAGIAIFTPLGIAPALVVAGGIAALLPESSGLKLWVKNPSNPDEKILL